MRRDEVLQFLADNQQTLRQDFRVKSLSLFGSVARDEATEASDVDFLVEFSEPTGLFGMFRLHDFLEQELGQKVDLGTPDSLKSSLRHHVLIVLLS